MKSGNEKVYIYADYRLYIDPMLISKDRKPEREDLKEMIAELKNLAVGAMV